MIISVIIPLYNKARFVQRSLDSVLRQNFTDFELLVIDDGSTDGSAEIVARCPDPRLKLMRQPNSGPGAARNCGLRVARGGLVAFLDADDEWLPDFLARGIDFLDRHPEVAAVSFGYRDAGRSLDETENVWDKRGVYNGVFNCRNGNLSPELADYLLAYMNSWSTIARKNVVLKHRGFFDRWKCLFGEDQNLWLKVMLNEKIAVRREIQVVFHSEASNLSGNLAGPSPVVPYLLNASDIISACPGECREFLNQFLAIRAVSTACHYTQHGEYAVARNLLWKYCRLRHPQMFWPAVVYAVFPWAVPFLRAGKRLFRLP